MQAPRQPGSPAQAEPIPASRREARQLTSAASAMLSQSPRMMVQRQVIRTWYGAAASLPVQRVLAGNGASEVQWNAICAELTDWRGARQETLENWITAAELAWNAQQRQPNWKASKIASLKNVIYSAVNADKRLIADSGNLGWDDITNYLAGLQALGLVTVATEHRALGGNHGNGTYWAATETVSGDDIETGTVPDAVHGLGAGALNGARGAVRTVIVAHNGLLDAIAQAVAAL